MDDRSVEELLKGKREEKTRGIRMPILLREKVILAAKNKFGGLNQERIFSAAFLYFAAYGVLAWEKFTVVQQSVEDIPEVAEVRQKKPRQRKQRKAAQGE